MKKQKVMRWVTRPETAGMSESSTGKTTKTSDKIYKRRKRTRFGESTATRSQDPPNKDQSTTKNRGKGGNLEIHMGKNRGKETKMKVTVGSGGKSEHCHEEKKRGGHSRNEEEGVETTRGIGIRGVGSVVTISPFTSKDEKHEQNHHKRRRNSQWTDSFVGGNCVRTNNPLKSKIRLKEGLPEPEEIGAAI